jgi:hypothetical protein
MEVRTKVKEIKDAAKAELYNNDADEFRRYYDREEEFDGMLNHPYLTINHLQ